MRSAGWSCGEEILRGISLVCICSLFGCGGGGGGGGERPEATPTATVTAAPVTATPTLSPSSTPLTPTAAPAPDSTDTPTPTQVPPTHTITPGPSLPPAPTDTPLPTATPTRTPLIGPVITAFAVADSSGTFNQTAGTDGLGRPIYSRQGGNDFIIYVEARPGQSRLPVGTNLLSTQLGNPAGQPDLQIVTSRPLGDGSAAVCDRSFPETGGIPAVEPPSFDFVQAVSDALNDLSCRFRVYQETDFACTQDSSGTFTFANGGSTVQFCVLVNQALTFPTGDTVLTVRLRDTAGQAGPPAQIVVRVRG